MEIAKTGRSSKAEIEQTNDKPAEQKRERNPDGNHLLCFRN